MYRFKVHGLKFDKYTDAKSTFEEMTMAVSEKKALSNIRYRLSGYILRDIIITNTSKAGEQDNNKQLLAFGG